MSTKDPDQSKSMTVSSISKCMVQRHVKVTVCRNRHDDFIANLPMSPVVKFRKLVISGQLTGKKE